MAKQPEFPIEIKAGSTVIRIGLNPLKSSGAQADAPAPIDVVNRKENKAYDSYVVSYSQGGKRLRTRHCSLEAARSKTNSVKTAVVNGDLTALSLEGEDNLFTPGPKT